MSSRSRWASELVPAVAIAGACFLMPAGGVMFSVATGIAGGLVTPLSQRGGDWCMQRLFRQKELLNHDLQAAMLRAFDQSMSDLQKAWLDSHERDATPHHSPGAAGRDAVKALFQDMREDAKTILSADRLRGIIGSPETIQLLDRGGLTMEKRRPEVEASQERNAEAGSRDGESDANTTPLRSPDTYAAWLKSIAPLGSLRVQIDEEGDALRAYLALYLDGHSEQLVRFMHDNFQSQLACRFGEELKRDTKAWRAFQRLVNDSLLDGVRAMLARQEAAQATLDALLGELHDWKERLARLPDTEREETGDPALEVMIVATGAKLHTAIDALRDENRTLHDRTDAKLEDLRINIQELGEDLQVGIQVIGVALRREDELPSRRVVKVPHSPNPPLVGRDGVLDAIERELAPDASRPRIAVLWGLGGVGKTQIASEYAFRRAKDTDVVWWLQAQSEASITGGYATLARALKLPEAEAQDQGDVVMAVVRWLEHSTRSWLLIFDDVERQEAIHPFIPGLGNGQVIVTTTSPAVGALTVRQRCHQIQPLATEQAADFLESRRGTGDRRSAEQLATALGGLPLALTQAAAFMGRNGASIATYLDLFEEHRLRLLDAPGAPADHQLTVTATLELALQRVQEDTYGRAAMDLISLCAFLAPELIPLDLIAAQRDGLPPSLQEALADGFAITMTVGALHAYSLVEVIDDRTLSVHRLVQEAVRESLSHNRIMWSEAALGVVDAGLPVDVRQSIAWHTYARLVEHAHACVDHMSRLAGDSPSIARLLSKTGIYLQERALYSQARADVERELEIMEANEEFSDVEIAAALDRYGGVLRSQGELDKAKDMMGRALSLVTGSTVGETTLAATIQNDLGNVLRAQGYFDEAERLFKESLTTYQAVIGRGHPRTTTVLNNLANLLWVQGRHVEAQPLLERALAIDIAHFGLNHPEVATSLSNLGKLLGAIGDTANAKPLLKQALQIDEAFYGSSHPKVAIHLSGLAELSQLEHDWDEAESLLREALQINQAFYGTHDSVVALNLNNLAAVLAIQDKDGKRNEAITMQERAVEIAEFRLGPDHPTAMLVRRNLNLLD